MSDFPKEVLPKELLPKEVLQVLAPATDAARRALARLDDEEVPAGLRRIAAYSGGRLPPPLLRQLVATVADDEGFRAKVQRELGSGETPAHAFVQQASGWWAEVAAAAMGIANRGAAKKQARLEADIAKAKAGLAEAKRRARTTPASTGKKDARARLDAAERGLLAAEKAARQAETAAMQRQNETRAEIEELVADLAVSQKQVARLRKRLEAARQAATEGTASGGRGLTRRPLELAKHLDRLAVLSSAAEPAPAPLSPAGSARPVRLPSGIAPDSSLAIQWLLDRKDRFAIVVDGYNVTFLVDAKGFGSARARRRLNHDLARLKRQAKSSPRVIVVYDSTLTGERDIESSPGGIEVRFAAEERLADEEIVDLVRELSGAVVVISTDREVREQAEAAGAVALWSQALVAWMKTAG